MTRSEEVLQALLARLQTITGPVIVRNEALTMDLPIEGLIVMHDGEPGEPEMEFSPLVYHYLHQAQLEVFAYSGDDRDAAFDDLKAKIAAALSTDRTLGGVVDWLEPMAPRVTDLTFEGADPVKAATITVTLHYSAADPLQ